MDGTITIYADVLFFINFSIDFLCLYITGKVLCTFFKLSGMAAAAALGGIYSCLAVYLEIELWYISLPMHIAAAILMCLTAFGRKSLLKNTAVFTLSCGLIGGLMCGAYAFTGKDFYAGGGFYMDVDPLFVLVFGAAASAAALLYMLLCRRRHFGKTADIRFSFGEKIFEARLLCDSGCFVRDAISGNPVIIVSRSVFGDDNALSGADESTLKALGKTSRLIPVNTVSGHNMLPAFRPAILIIKYENTEKTLPAIIAVDCNGTPYGDCDGIIPTEALL